MSKSKYEIFLEKTNKQWAEEKAKRQKAK